MKWSEAVRYRAEGAATTDALAAIDRTYARLPFPELHWPAWPTRQYGRDDIIVETHADDWIWATTRSAAALSELDALVRAAGMDEWESYDD